MNTTEFCRKLNLKKTTLYQYLYMEVIPKPTRFMQNGGRGRPAFDWTRDDLRKAKKILGARHQGGAREGAGRKPEAKPKPKAKAKAKASRSHSKTPARTARKARSTSAHSRKRVS